LLGVVFFFFVGWCVLFSSLVFWVLGCLFFGCSPFADIRLILYVLPTNYFVPPTANLKNVKVLLLHGVEAAV